MDSLSAALQAIESGSGPLRDSLAIRLYCFLPSTCQSDSSEDGFFLMTRSEIHKIWNQQEVVWEAELFRDVPRFPQPNGTIKVHRIIAKNPQSIFNSDETFDICREILKVRPVAIRFMNDTSQEKHLTEILTLVNNESVHMIAPRLRTYALNVRIASLGGLWTIPEDQLTQELCDLDRGRHFYSVPVHFQNYQMCLNAVRRSSYNLRRVKPEFLTRELCLYASPDEFHLIPNSCVRLECQIRRMNFSCAIVTVFYAVILGALIGFIKAYS